MMTRFLQRSNSLRTSCLLFVVTAICICTQPHKAMGQIINSMTFSSGTGSQLTPGTWTNIFNSGSDDDVATVTIPFSFTFAGTTSTSMGICTNGNLVVGGSSTWDWTNNLTAYTGFPRIVGFWDDLRVDGSVGGVVRAGVTGSSPNRVAVFEWNNVEIAYYSYYYGTWQVRLYEGSNKIEFWYGSMSSSHNTNATIGLAATSSDYISLTPTSTGATISSTSVNNSVNLSSTPISSGRLYTFTPCSRNITIAGNTLQGGTSAMAAGDTLFKNMQVQRGNSQAYQPYTVTNGALACNTRTFGYSITGPNAGDYQISPTTGSLAASNSNTPTLTFTPGGTGIRTATLTIVDDNGFNRAYLLRASGTTRIQWTGNVAQGGTSGVANGDTLLSSKIVVRKTSQGFTPITITNTNANIGAPVAQVTYSINDPSGQYSISPASALIGANQSSTPTITFAASGVGYQPATLTVNADGEIRTYTLYVFSAAPGGTFTLNAQQLGPTVGVLTNYSNCTGEYSNTQAITVANTGFGDFNILNVNFYQTDTIYGQGSPTIRCCVTSRATRSHSEITLYRHSQGSHR